MTSVDELFKASAPPPPNFHQSLKLTVLQQSGLPSKRKLDPLRDPSKRVHSPGRSTITDTLQMKSTNPRSSPTTPRATSP